MDTFYRHYEHLVTYFIFTPVLNEKQGEPMSVQPRYVKPARRVHCHAPQPARTHRRARQRARGRALQPANRSCRARKPAAQPRLTAQLDGVCLLRTTRGTKHKKATPRRQQHQQHGRFWQSINQSTTQQGPAAPRLVPLLFALNKRGNHVCARVSAREKPYLMVLFCSLAVFFPQVVVFTTTKL